MRQVKLMMDSVSNGFAWDLFGHFGNQETIYFGAVGEVARVEWFRGRVEYIEFMRYGESDLCAVEMKIVSDAI